MILISPMLGHLAEADRLMPNQSDEIRPAFEALPSDLDTESLTAAELSGHHYPA